MIPDRAIPCTSYPYQVRYEYRHRYDDCWTENRVDTRYDKQYNQSTIVIVNDPLEIGGFATGVRLSQDALMYMLKEGSFTEGTVVQIGDEHWRIVSLIGQDGKRRQKKLRIGKAI